MVAGEQKVGCLALRQVLAGMDGIFHEIGNHHGETDGVDVQVVRDIQAYFRADARLFRHACVVADGGVDGRVLAIDSAGRWRCVSVGLQQRGSFSGLPSFQQSQ